MHGAGQGDRRVPAEKQDQTRELLIGTLKVKALLSATRRRWSTPLPIWLSNAPAIEAFANMRLPCFGRASNGDRLGRLAGR
jgi:hypothetical protein